MNVHMYEHPAVQKYETLRDYGYRFIERGRIFGLRLRGKGRLEEPENRCSLEQYFRSQTGILKGKSRCHGRAHQEKIDPVRFISNYSTGKMGYAIAEEAVLQGAEVTLISGPVSLAPPQGVTLISVESAEEMYEAVMKVFLQSDLVVKTAAVADYRPKQVSEHKVKKQPGEQVIELERTKDILYELGRKKGHQVLVGFAAETINVEEYAKKKLVEKNADMIVANNVKVEGAGFGTDTNIVTIYKKDGTVIELPLMTKRETAKKILEEAAAILKGEEKQ